MEISREEFDAYSGGITNLTSSAQNNLANFIDNLDFGSSEESIKNARNQVIEYMQELVPAYSNASSALAGDFYAEILEREKGELVDSLLSDLPSDNSVASSVRYSAKHLFGNNIDVKAFKEGCMRSLDSYISRSANDTMKQNALRDGKKHGVKYARVPTGITCAFCVMLASRGFVYATTGSAGEFGKYHSHCDCRIIPGFDGMTVEGYDPDQLYTAYRKCYETVQDKYRHASTDDVLAEMYRRSKLWLNTGQAPEVFYESKELKDEIARLRPWEARTAGRLAAEGYEVKFIQDSREYIDPITKLTQYAGLADTEQGLELKTIMNATKRSTIDDALRSASHKEGLVRVVIDNYEALYLSDAITEEYIRSCMNKRGISEVLMITKYGSLKLIQ